MGSNVERAQREGGGEIRDGRIFSQFSHKTKPWGRAGTELVIGIVGLGIAPPPHSISQKHTHTHLCHSVWLCSLHVRQAFSREEERLVQEEKKVKGELTKTQRLAG